MLLRANGIDLLKTTLSSISLTRKVPYMIRLFLYFTIVFWKLMSLVSDNTFLVTVLQDFNTCDRSHCWGAWERKDTMAPFPKRLRTALSQDYGLTHQLTLFHSLQLLTFHSWTFSFFQSSLRPVAVSKRELKLTCWQFQSKIHWQKG